MEERLVVGGADTFLSADAVAVVDCFPLDEVAAGEFDYNVGFLDEGLEFAHLN